MGSRTYLLGQLHVLEKLAMATKQPWRPFPNLFRGVDSWVGPRNQIQGLMETLEASMSHVTDRPSIQF